jgi:uncharacterized protein YkwD
MLLRKLSATALAVAALLPMGGMAQRPDLGRVEDIIVGRTNDFRREQGLQPVASDAKLEAAARYFAQYMARTERYGHQADGKEPADRATRHGYDYCLVAENISYQYSSEDFATTGLALRYVEGWKKSPGHRKNMLSPHAIDTGVAVARGESGRYYAVQMFGRRKSAGVEFRITNAARDTVRYEVGGEVFTLSPGSARVHTHCTPDELVLLAGKRPKATPRNGDRITVVREAGGLTLRAAP